MLSLLPSLTVMLTAEKSAKRWSFCFQLELG